MTLALTALAMWIRSWRIACMRPRWYFITGVCPVTKDSALAQPVPNSIDSAPRWAASSTPPGSPVTYRPGMPTEAPAEARRITLLSTVRSEEHTSELQSRGHLVCRLLLEKKNRDRKTERSKRSD